MTILDFIFFSSVILLLIISGLYKSKQIRSEATYLFADRKISWSALTATLVMTEFNSATLISFSSLGYLAGFRALTLPFIFLFGLLFYAFTVAKKWKAFDGVSVAGFFTQRYGKKIGKCTSILLLLAMTGFSAAYIKSLSLLFHPLFPALNLWGVSGIFLAIVFAMSFRGGLLSIIRTDVLSLILMLFFFPLMAFFMWKSPNLPPIVFSALEETLSQKLLPTRFISSLIILTMFTYILAPWYGQKIFAAKSGKVAFWATVAASILIFFLYATAILATAFFKYRGFECPSSEEALPCLIDRCLPNGLKGFAYSLIFATSATTLTGVWNTMSAMWLGDFWKASESSNKETSCHLSMAVTVFFALLSWIVANVFVDRVFDKLILTNIPVAALSFGLLAGFYWKKASRVGVYFSILTGCLCGVGSYLIFGEEGGYTWYWSVYGIPLIFLTGILMSLFFPQRLRGPQISLSRLSRPQV